MLWFLDWLPIVTSALAYRPLLPFPTDKPLSTPCPPYTLLLRLLLVPAACCYCAVVAVAVPVPASACSISTSRSESMKSLGACAEALPTGFWGASSRP